MARLLRGFLGGVLLVSVTFAVGAAEPEVCVASDDVTTCPSSVAEDGAANTDSLDSETVDASMPAVQPTPAAVTRVLDPPTAVQPFATVAVSVARPDEQAPRAVQPQPADQQKLPPGPPSRFP